MAATQDLKHLSFIPSYASFGYEKVANSPYTAKAASVYASAKEKSMLKPGLDKLESALTYYGTPLFTKAVEVAPAVLARADNKVASALTTGKGIWEDRVLPSKPMKAATAVKNVFYAKHPENLELFKQARDEYFTLIETSIETLKARGVSLSDDAVKSVTAALESARASATAAVPTQKLVLEKASAAWEKIAAQPTVAVALGKIIPQINKAKVQAHVFLSAIQENEAYKAYAEPTISRVMTSPYYLKMVDYVKPIVAGPAN